MANFVKFNYNVYLYNKPVQDYCIKNAKPKKYILYRFEQFYR